VFFYFDVSIERSWLQVNESRAKTKEPNSIFILFFKYPL